MNILFLIAVIGGLLFFVAKIIRLVQRIQRADYVRSYQFPPSLLAKLATRYPELNAKEQQLVARALRQYFLAYIKSDYQFVSMPSQVVDELWHEFILYTRHYAAFCNKAFGRFMHHTPAVVLGASRQNNTGLRRVWWYACVEENIKPKQATRLPLLFAIDSKLHIKPGYHYVLDCGGVRAEHSMASSSPYCAGEMSSSHYDGATDGLGDADGSSSDSGGDSGCGGGCGGGD